MDKAWFNGPVTVVQSLSLQVVSMTDACLTPSQSMPTSAEYEAFMALVDEHGGSLLAMLRRLCRHEQNAEDIFQETAARVWRTFPDRPRLTNPRGWLMTIGYRV